MHVDGALVRHLAHHGVDDDVGAGAAHARAAVHHNWTAPGRIRACRLLDERQHGQDVVRNPVIRPVGKMVLIHETLGAEALQVDLVVFFCE